MQGIKRDRIEPERRSRIPLTRAYLLQFLASLSFPSYDNLVLQAAFTLAFAGFLRDGECTYKAADTDLGPSFWSWFLTKSSIRIRRDGADMEVELTSSKTDPFRKGITLVIAATNDTHQQKYILRQKQVFCIWMCAVSIIASIASGASGGGLPH